MLEFIKEHQIANYECDRNSKLRIKSIFNLLQDSLDQFSTARGIGHDFCRENNLTYVIRNYDVQVYALPGMSENISIHSFLSATKNSSMYFRQELKNTVSRQTLIMAATQTVLLDLCHMRPVRLNDRLPAGSLREQLNQPIVFEHLRTLERIHHTKTQDVLWDHIDFNQHINNANYIAFAQNVLSPAFLDCALPRRIQVSYLQPTTLGDTVRIDTDLKNTDATDHQILSTQKGKLLARVRINWARSR